MAHARRIGASPLVQAGVVDPHDLRGAHVVQGAGRADVVLDQLTVQLQHDWLARG